MCSEYTLRTSEKKIRDALGILPDNETSNDKWDKRIKLFSTAPVVAIAQSSPRLVIRNATFPVKPNGNARLSGLEFNEKTNEDEFRRIYDRPTWKGPFMKARCIIPVSSIFEPAYWGEMKGSVVEFSDPKNELLFVPGIQFKTYVPKSEYLGFSMLTHTASEQMFKYHHRLVHFLKPKDAIKWLEHEGSAQEVFEFLLEKRYIPKFNVSEDRKMASGWKSRVVDHEEALEDEKKYMKFLKNEGVEG